MLYALLVIIIFALIWPEATGAMIRAMIYIAVWAVIIVLLFAAIGVVYT